MVMNENKANEARARAIEYYLEQKEKGKTKKANAKSKRKRNVKFPYETKYTKCYTKDS